LCEIIEMAKWWIDVAARITYGGSFFIVAASLTAL
jgi:hypothetical protein